MTDAEQNKRVVEQFMDLVDNPRDLDRLDTFLTPDHVNHALAPGRPNGVEGTRQFLASPGRQAHHGRWVRRVVVADGDHVVEYGTRAGNWPAGTFRDYDIPGGPYEQDVAFMYRLSDGRIAERWAVRDDLGLIVRLGGRPQAPTP
jgi:ketosteroid isomerase-like protein